MSTDEPSGLRRRLGPHSLLGAGALMLVLVIAYIGSAAVFIAIDRERLVANATAMEMLQRQVEALGRAEDVLAQAAIEVSTLTYAATASAASTVASPISVEAAITALQRLDHQAPMHQRGAAQLAENVRRVADEPTRANWLELRELLWAERRQLAMHREQVEVDADRMRHRFVQQYRDMGLTWAIVAGTGVIGAALLMIPYFARMARDVRRVQAHAVGIAAGRRGERIELRRNDEVGSLAEAIDQIAEDLRDRELRLEIARSNSAHREKMATIGALATGVAHEVNNPLAAIDGLAQQLADPAAAGDQQRVAEAAAEILSQVQRVSSVTRQLADLAAPQPSDFEWIDVNDLVRRATSLLRYDRRYRGIRIDLDLAPDLPAVQTIGAALQQVLMDLVAAIARHGATVPGAALAIRTHSIGGPVSILIDTPLPIGVFRSGPQQAVSDGAGTTAAHDDPGRSKSAGTVAGDAGSDDATTATVGPGGVERALVLARATIERAGGLIEIEAPAANGGTRLRVTLPQAG